MEPTASNSYSQSNVNEQQQNTSEGRKINFSLDFLRTPAGILRLTEGILSFCGLVSGAVGSHCILDGRYDYFLFVTIVTFIQSITIIMIHVLQLEGKFTSFNLPLIFLFTDFVMLLLYFVASILVMLSIGHCYYLVTARLFASLFSIASFLTLTGLMYVNFQQWKHNEQIAEEIGSAPTLNERSSTVLT